MAKTKKSKLDLLYDEIYGQLEEIATNNQFDEEERLDFFNSLSDEISGFIGDLESDIASRE